MIVDAQRIIPNKTTSKDGVSCRGSPHQSRLRSSIVSRPEPSRFRSTQFVSQSPGRGLLWFLSRELFFLKSKRCMSFCISVDFWVTGFFWFFRVDSSSSLAGVVTFSNKVIFIILPKKSFLQYLYSFVYFFSVKIKLKNKFLIEEKQQFFTFGKMHF